MKNLLIIILFLSCNISFAIELNEKFFKTLAIIESNQNNHAVGDNGKAWGKYQIWNIYVEDVNRISKTSFIHQDAFDEQKAKKMITIYLNHYGKRYQRLTNNKVTIEVLARIHNGGPNGFKKHQTDKYAKKFLKIYYEL